jgi:ribosomal protein S17E
MDNEEEEVKLFFDTLKQNLEIYFSQYLDPYFSCEHIRISTMLDPRFKLSFENNKTEAKQLLRRYYEEFKSTFVLNQILLHEPHQE